MLYEDLVQQFNRVKLEIVPKMEKVVLELNEVKGRLEGEVEDRDEVIEGKEGEIV